MGSTLKPGRAVLTLGVFRRLRSVAYVRADASPSEVHAELILALEGDASQLGSEIYKIGGSPIRPRNTLGT
ncbi:hypothetical protein MKUB_54830 [Mycobacterium kubicae]|uniref:Uncharacterized protein n=1 Tax=Mycobacterium kubicae TaxID=120959 RepID=A0ABQ1BWC4_9MYCO|nr:hypothetical protein MKUB_54830 [Mycobacterium kubicae]